MELLALVFVWPLIVLVLGLVFISLNDIGIVYVVYASLLFLFAFPTLRKRMASEAMVGGGPAQLEYLRRFSIGFSIALLLPVFVRYLLLFANSSLWSIIVGLALGFGIVIWGMFMKGHRVLTFSNVLGGALVIGYVYAQLWELGELPRIIAAAFGLVVAVVISVVKLRDKLR